MQADKEECVVSVFFGGTLSSFADETTQIELFGKWSAKPRMMFDGVGRTNGLLGVVFACGLSRQADIVVEKLREIRHDRHIVAVNAVGLSRGGCACLILARKMQDVFGDAIPVNFLLYDPVPGNNITTTKLDGLQLSLAAQTEDLRACSCVRRVLAVYPRVPLRALELHAPVMPRFHQSTVVEWDVLLGCHQAAMWSFRVEGLDRRLSFVMIKRFLSECGTRLEGVCPGWLGDDECCEEAVLRELDMHAAKTHIPTVRHTHSVGNVLIHGRAQAVYVNRFHRRLRGGVDTAGTDDLLCYIQWHLVQ